MQEVKLPQLGQSVEEASIVEWRKQEGESVGQGEVLFTVQTDKAEIECESTASGVLRKILVQPDVEVPVMTVVALVGDADEALPDLSQYGEGGGDSAPEASQASVPEPAPETQAPAPQAAAPRPMQPGEAVRVSPRARKKAEELGIDPASMQGSGAQGRVIEADVKAQAGGAPAADVKVSPVARRLAANMGVDLAGIEGSGPGGRVMKEDVQRAGQAAAARPQQPAAAQMPAAAAEPAEGIEVVPLSPMRKVIAQRMGESMYSAPHYYVTCEIDMEQAVAFRKASAGFRPSFNDLILAAAVRSLREHPMVNARWGGDHIARVAEVNLGVAVALPDGLIVPVLKQAHTLSLEGIHNETRALIEKARTGKLLPDDYTGSTFTVSNLGSFGVDQFTAIINQPNSAILAVGRIKEKPVVVDGGIHIRPMMNLTLSSDHRVVDGAVAAQFMATLRKTLEHARF